MVDFKSILIEASTTGIASGNYILNTRLVTGGLISLDGVHLTSRGYAVMANEIMRAIDATYGSNAEASGNFVDCGDYPRNYSTSLLLNIKISKNTRLLLTTWKKAFLMNKKGKKFDVIFKLKLLYLQREKPGVFHDKKFSK